MKKKTIIYIISLFLFSFYIQETKSKSYLQKKCEVDVRSSYEDSLYKAVEIIQGIDSISPDLLLFCIPVNKNDAIKYFNLDYKDEEKYQLACRELSNSWCDKCLEKDTLFIVHYFQFSQFVDGYFAEDYFININKIYNKLQKETCQMLKLCEQDEIKRLLIYLEEKDMCDTPN